MSLLKQTSFQTTYEELKHFDVDSRPYLIWLPDYLWGIETGWVLRCPRLSRCFQTTYEELKRNQSRHYCLFSNASRLPMRNWNYVNTSPIEYALPSFQTTYEELKPWPSSVDWSGGSAPLPDYLWGIETNSDYSVEETLTRFQTTYEELKPDN